MRVAVVAPGVHDRWDEVHVVARRLAGALAHEAEVSVLVPGAERATATEGLLAVETFEAMPGDAARARVLRVAVSAAGAAVASWEDELFTAEGAWSPALVEHVCESSWDVVVLVGATRGVASFCARALPGDVPVVVASVVDDPARLSFAGVRRVLDRADVVVTFSESERSVVERAVGGGVRRLGFVVRTNEIAAQSVPIAFPRVPVVTVTTDWSRLADRPRWLRWSTLLQRDVGARVDVRAVGPAANRVPPPLAGESSPSRIDSWRWISHSLAVVDPAPYCSVGIPALEALTFGVPVIVPAGSGASVEHADRGNCGLWYRGYDELRACIELLLDEPQTRAALGRSGRAYEEEGFGDTKRFVADVLDAVLSLA